MARLTMWFSYPFGPSKKFAWGVYRRLRRHLDGSYLADFSAITVKNISVDEARIDVAQIRELAKKLGPSEITRIKYRITDIRDKVSIHHIGNYYIVEEDVFEIS